MSSIWRRHIADQAAPHHRCELGRHIRKGLDRLAADLESARKIGRILLESESVPTAKQVKHVLPGDPALLRGLPAVGVRGGFGGAIRGSRPGDSLHED